MSLTIQIKEESAALLARQAAAHGPTVEAWIEELAHEKAANEAPPEQQKARSAIARNLEIQKLVKPDPEAWTIRDYINLGRP